MDDFHRWLWDNTQTAAGVLAAHAQENTEGIDVLLGEGQFADERARASGFVMLAKMLANQMAAEWSMSRPEAMRRVALLVAEKRSEAGY